MLWKRYTIRIKTLKFKINLIENKIDKLEVKYEISCNICALKSKGVEISVINNKAEEHISISYKKTKLISFITKTLLSLLFLTFCSGFTYSNNVQEVPEYIREIITTGNINLEDKITVDLKTKISQEEYEKTIKDVENFLKENHIIFNNTSREEFSKECDKFIKDKKEHTIVDTILDLKVLTSRLKQGHVGLKDNYFTEILPIKLSEFSDGVYITTSYKNDIDILGSKLLGINDISITEVESKLFKYAYGENKNFRHISSIGNLVILDMLKRENIVKGQEVRFKLLKDGEVFYKNINPYKIEKREYGRLNSDYSDMYFIDSKKMEDKIKNTDFTTIAPLERINLIEKNFYTVTKNKDLIIYYNSCSDNEEFNMHNFSKEINEKLHKNKPSNIVIDLRYNVGGRSELYHQILKELEFYQLSNPDTKIKILVGSFTYSASGFATLETMRTLDNVEIIGGDSGFTIKTTTGVDSLFYIKNLKVYCQYAARFLDIQNYQKEDVFQHNYKNYDYERDMLTPDFHAEQSFADYMIGNDPAMNYALRDEVNSSLFDKIKGFLYSKN